MEKNSIIIVDDHKIVRDGIRAMLIRNNELAIVAEASDAKEAISKIMEFSPDLAIVDIGLPGDMPGIELSIYIKKHFPNTKILILTANTDNDTVKSSIKAGVDGFLTKDTSRQEFINALDTIIKNGQYYGEWATKTVFESLKNENSENNNKQNANLTQRETEIVINLCNGLTYKEIGKLMFISSRTVESHKNNILDKLQLKNTTELIKWAIKNKIVII